MPKPRTYTGAFSALVIILTVVLCLGLSLPIYAADRASLPAGHVLYRQNFADTKGAFLTGMYFGELSCADAYAKNIGGKLTVNGSFDVRSYLLLPAETEGNTYTMIATLRMSDLSVASGYCGILISGWGNEPRNRAEIILRANGSFDDFSSPSERLRDALASGAEFTVTVPVRNGAVNEISVSSDGVSETLVRDQIMIVTGGTVGFSLRNMSVELSEVLLVNGVDYAELSGVFASNSYSTSAVEDDGIKPNQSSADDPSSPPTSDASVIIAAVAIISSVGLSVMVVRFIKERKNFE